MLKTCLNIIWSFGEGIAFSSHILLKILELEENWRKILNISKSEYYSVGGVLKKGELLAGIFFLGIGGKLEENWKKIGGKLEENLEHF